MDSSQRPAKPSRRYKRSTSLRRLHRWLGLGAVVFLLLLTATGILLNHSAELELGEYNMTADWLLEWYGLEMPPVSASYSAEGTFVTLVGQRLFIDALPALSGIAAVRGAVAASGYVIVATDDELLVFAPSAELVDRVRLETQLDAPIGGLGRARDGSALGIRTDAEILILDSESLSILDAELADIRWSEHSTPDPALLDEIERQYRGEGVTLERLLYDVHSGRVLSRAGVLLMDIVGIILIGLSITGLIVWLRQRRP
jgi:hypothetical protein